MTRSIAGYGALVVALTLPLAGCEPRQAAAPKAQATVTSAPSKLADPLEKDRDVLAMKKPGHWQVKGKDQLGRMFEGYLVVEHAADAFATTGFFEWTAQEAGGRYRFTGTFDPGTRQVRWTGFTVEDRFGVACNAVYRATLSADGRQLVNGSWDGGISVPGTWSAELVIEP